MFLDRFDVLMLKIDFKKNIILMHFQAKSTLKSILYHTPKHLYMVYFKSVFHYKIHQNKFFSYFFFNFYIITSKLSKSTKKYFNLMLFQVKRAKKRTSCTPKQKNSTHAIPLIPLSQQVSIEKKKKNKGQAYLKLTITG